jgi:penicillin-binding protein 1B
MPRQSPKTKRPARRPRKAAAAKSRPVKKKAAPKRRSPWLGRLVLCGIVTFVTLTALCVYNDRVVEARLRSLGNSTLPVIYSSPLDISGTVARLSSSKDRPQDRLRAILFDRRYSEVSSPTKPGEFSVSDNALEIVTREFRSPSGSRLPSRKLKLSLHTGELVGARGDATAAPLLEPQVISYIGTTELRASKFTPLNKIPNHVRQAVLAIEDERFYDHFGLDVIGIARATLRNILAMRLVEGGSTLTQQLAKNLFLSPKKTIWRKLAEVPTALSLERHLSKDQLLELYLNEVYLGQEGAIAVHGFPEAASAFFGKRIEDLSQDEAAVLAGIIKAPSYYNPRKHPERARERRNTVLGKMRDLGFIGEADHASGITKPLTTAPQLLHRRVAPYFASALEAELSQSIDLESAPVSGLAVYTGVDLGMQRCAEHAIENGLARLEKNHPRLAKKSPPLEAALVAIEPHSGLIKAWVGGRDFSQSQFNRVSQGVRQIGSTIKPFLYLTALDGTLNSYKVASPISVLEDKPMAIAARRQATWIPENYDRDFRGDVTLRFALENSLNMPAIYVAQRVGIPALARTVEAFQLASSVPRVPALALGALDTTLLKITSSYGALASMGIHVQPRLFVSALDDAGARLSTSTIVERRIADESASFVLTNMLQGVLSRGTGKAARSAGFEREAAGKTGTSDKARDAWFIGYTPNLSTGVWVGFDDNDPTGLSGGQAAAPIWSDFMKCSEPFVADLPFIRPPGVSVVRIDANSGEVATRECPSENVVEEVFVRGTEPSSYCSQHSGEPARGSLDEDSRATLESSNESRARSFWQTLFK